MSELSDLRARMAAEVEKVGMDALAPSVEEWKGYLAARGVSLTQPNLDAALVAVAGVMATTAQLASVKPKAKPGRVTPRKADDARLANIIQGIQLSALALSCIEPEENRG